MLSKSEAPPLPRTKYRSALGCDNFATRGRADRGIEQMAFVSVCVCLSVHLCLCVSACLCIVCVCVCVCVSVCEFVSETVVSSDTQAHLTHRHLTQRHLTHRHLTQRHLTHAHLTQRHLTQRASDTQRHHSTLNLCTPVQLHESTSYTHIHTHTHTYTQAQHIHRHTQP